MGLQEAIPFRSGHESGGALGMTLVVGRWPAGSAGQEESSPEPDAAGTQLPEIRENTCVFFSHQSVALCHHSMGRSGQRGTTE